MNKKPTKINPTVGVSFYTKADKERALRRAKEVCGNNGFSRYVRGLIERDMQPAPEAK